MLNDILMQVSNGQAVIDAANGLKELVQAVRSTRKAGKLTLEVSIAPIAKGGADAVTLDYNVRLKLPENERPTTIFYAMSDGRLQRNDPRQQTLPLRVVAMDEQEAKEAK